MDTFVHRDKGTLCLRENDQHLGIHEEKVVKAESPKIQTNESDVLMQLFKEVAGSDNEIDWKELKEILDNYTKRDLSTEEEPSANAKNVDGVGAVKGEGQENSTETNVVTTMLALLCGTLCKDTLEPEVIPAPTQELPLNSAFPENNKGFSKDVCRSMIAMLDTDRTGKLNFEEFKRLFTLVKTWKGVFKKYDKNGNGTLDGFELRTALNSAGYSLNNRILNILVQRYGNKTGKIEFDDFIMCAVKLKIMIDLFKETSQNGEDTATFTLDQWIETTLYA